MKLASYLSQHLLAVMLMWLTVSVAGLVAFTVYDTRSGRTPSAPAIWPVEQLGEHPGVPVAVAFIHPQCPCTRATLHELSELSRERTWHLHLVVRMPTEKRNDSDWQLSRDWIRKLQPDQITSDSGGILTQSLGAYTSGTIYGYDNQGYLGFAGGLTLSRGHRGWTSSHDALLAVVAPNQSRDVNSLQQTPIFGCELSQQHSEIPNVK